jgi:predicted O-methyltransferase YrrM
MSNRKPLKELFDWHDCDKSQAHKYYKIYEKYFEELRDEPINLLEIGIFRGASTKAWLDYFPNAKVYTIDTFERVPPRKIGVLKSSRVRWLKGDSTHAGVGKRLIDNWGMIKFDFIIDDGAHWPEAQKNTFKNFFPFLKEGGTYFCEDVFPMHIMNKDELDYYWFKKHPERYDMLKHMDFINTIDMRDGKTSYHDQRNESKYKHDSFIISIQK